MRRSSGLRAQPPWGQATEESSGRMTSHHRDQGTAKVGNHTPYWGEYVGKGREGVRARKEDGQSKRQEGRETHFSFRGGPFMSASTSTLHTYRLTWLLPSPRSSLPKAPCPNSRPRHTRRPPLGQLRHSPRGLHRRGRGRRA